MACPRIALLTRSWSTLVQVAKISCRSLSAAGVQLLHAELTPSVHFSTLTCVLLFAQDLSALERQAKCAHDEANVARRNVAGYAKARTSRQFWGQTGLSKLHQGTASPA